MEPQVVCSDEGLPTRVAHMRPLSSVSAFVFFEVTRRDVRVFTEAAFVRPLSTVDAQVQFQTVSFSERLATLLTSVSNSSIVRVLMFL